MKTREPKCQLTLITTLAINKTCKQAKHEANTMKASLSASELATLSPIRVTTACQVHTRYRKIMLPRM